MMKIACFTTPPEHKIIKINQFMDTPLLFAVCICFIIHTVYAAASARGHPCLMEISLLYNNTFTTTTEHLIMPPPKTTNPHFLLMALLYMFSSIFIEPPDAWNRKMLGSTHWFCCCRKLSCMCRKMHSPETYKMTNIDYFTK